MVELIQDDDPRLVEMCLNCTRTKCDGVCAEYKAFDRKINPPRRKPVYTAARYEMDGKSLTLVQWAREYGVSYKTLKERMATGKYTLKQALETPTRRINQLFEAFGKRMLMSEWEKESGISQYTLYSRIRRGIPLEEALTKPTGRNHG